MKPQDNKNVKHLFSPWRMEYVSSPSSDNNVFLDALKSEDDRESLMESYGPVMNFVRDRGWRFTGRSHIMAFNTERCV